MEEENTTLTTKQAADVISELMQNKEQQQKAVGSTGSATLLTQPQGIFSAAGADNVVVSTHIQPQGLGAVLPVFEDNVDDPRFTFITGFGDDIGSEAATPCDDAPTGYMKGGYLTSAFGRIVRDTETIEIDSTLHETRGANMNLRLLNNMLNGSATPFTQGLNMQNIADLVVQSEMVNTGVRLERKLSTMVWQGSVANNNIGGGYKEFPGLDSQIATGQVDAETNTAMPAADSLIMDFNYANIGGTVNDIVEYLSEGAYYVDNIAQRTGMDPVQWALVCRPEAWYELSAVWPCRYLTNRCATDSGSNPMVINDNVNVAMRDQMRRTMTIDINGRTFPVVTDTGIFEHTNINNANVPAGSYASSFYLVPLRARGNFPVTYWNTINYRRVQRQVAVMGQGANKVPFWTDNGRLLWAIEFLNFCFKLKVKVEPRIVLRTPHLALKLQNVLYSPLQHLRDPDPQSPYWFDGGVSTRSATSGSAVWR